MTRQLRTFRYALRSSHGQNIVEYLLLTTAIVLVLLVFLNPQNSIFRRHMESTLDLTVNSIDGIARNINFGNGAIP